ncbi:hypothetical protein WJX74_010574 [Apatococcus lobatus]|uniref:Uncharacterized protein n=1 Tax=Apatococcus lobatus TaxID=904363 RepID=A0AAW1QTH2_9CHLO
MQDSGFGFFAREHTVASEERFRRPLGKSRSALSTELGRLCQQQPETDEEANSSPLIRASVAPAEPLSSFQAGSRRVSDSGRQSSSGRWSLDASRPEPTPAAANSSCSTSARRVPLRRATVTSIPQPQASPLTQEDMGPGIDGAFVPPHLLSASLPVREAAADDPFRPGSVMVGNGRKLKGYDADRFKRTIMRRTGFLEEL